MAFDFNKFANDPMTMMGMGFLGGNYGPNSRAAFANAMQGGLRAAQAGQMMGLRRRTEDREREEFEHKLKQAEMDKIRAAAQAQALGMKNPGLYADPQNVYKAFNATKQPSMVRTLQYFNTPEGKELLQKQSQQMGVSPTELLKTLAGGSSLTVDLKPPSDTMAKDAAQAAGVLDMIGNVTDYLDVSGGDQLTGLSGALNELRSQTDIWGLGTNAILNALGKEIDPEVAFAIGQIGQINLQAIQILRGAQVGPKEEEMVKRYLPAAGQDIKTMRANLAILGEMTSAIQRRTRLIKKYNYDEERLSQLGLAKDQIRDKYDWLSEDGSEEPKYEYRTLPDGRQQRRRIN